MSDIHCFYVSEGLLTSNHKKRIGSSIWEFLWLISHETKMAGKVLNGSPITVSRIAEELGSTAQTTKRNLENLEKQGYITRKRKSRGLIYSYSIAHSKKWRIHWEETMGSVKNGTTNGSGTKNDTSISMTVDEVVSKMTPGSIKNDPTNKEDRQLDNISSKESTFIKRMSCTKCGGRGIYFELVPSKLNPEFKARMPVKCECQQ